MGRNWIEIRVAGAGALFPPFRLQEIAIRSAISRIGNKKQSDFCAMMALQFLVVQPNSVHLGPIDVTVSGGMLNVTLPPASVTKLEITLV